MQGNRVKRLLSQIFNTEEEEADCGECYAHIDRFAEMLEAGDEPAVVLPRVEQHLKVCGECSEELRALLAMLRAEIEPDS